jgi:hypothetical protein
LYNFCPENSKIKDYKQELRAIKMGRREGGGEEEEEISIDWF